MEWSELDNATVRDSDKPFLVDFRGPGHPLVVCFGAYESMRLPPFEFFGRLRKVEKLTGRTINKILVRDATNSWYHRGIPGLGADIAATVARLGEMIAAMGASRTFTIGQSMGAFGAILYGALLEIDEAIAFGPLAVFDSAVRARFSDGRWGDVERRVEASPPPVFYRDLPRLIDSLPDRTRYHVYYGTKPTQEPDDKMRYVEAVNYDAIHGFLYGQSARVAARPVKWSSHRVPAYLREVGIIDELVARRILSTPFAPESYDDLPIDPGWIRWMEGNFTMGFDDKVLVPQVRVSFPTTSQTVTTAFARMRRNVLRRML